MKRLLLFLLISFLIAINWGCSDNDVSSPKIYHPECDYEAILALPGSSDAPILYIFKDSEEDYIILCWTNISGAYYEVQESTDACFDSWVFDYTMYDNYFTNAVKNGYFYRVRALSPAGETGWSNVKLGQYGGIL